MVAAITYPERVGKFVMGGSHIGTGGDRYLMANRPSEGNRATRQALDDPSRENIARYLRVHIDDDSLVTDELIDYIHHAHTWSPDFMDARSRSVSVPHDYTPELAAIRAPVLPDHGRAYDRMVAFEVSIAILNHIEDSRVVLLNNCGHWAPFEKPAEWTAHVLSFCRDTDRPVPIEHVETLIVGGGQAGLAMSEQLSKRGRPHLIVERHRIVERWRSERWDGLHANGPSWSESDSMPGHPIPGVAPRRVREPGPDRRLFPCIR